MALEQADQGGGQGMEEVEVPGLDPGVLAATLLEASPDGVIVVDEDGMVVVVNRSLEELFGHERDRLVGQPVETLLPVEYRQVHTAHRLRYRAAPHVRAMGQDLDLWGRRADGAEFPIEVSLSPCRIGHRELVIATVRDVTVRRAAEQDRRNTYQALDGLGEAVFFADPDTLRFTYANQAAVELTGYPRADLVGMTPSHLLPDLSPNEQQTVVAPILADETQLTTFATRLRSRDGAELTVEFELMHPPAPRGQTRHLVIIVRDITDRLARAAQDQHLAELAVLVQDRERIARDLHDTAIQELFAAGLALQSLTLRLDPDPDTRHRLMDIIDRQDEVIRQIRTAIFGLTNRDHDQASLINQTHAVANEATRILGYQPTIHTSGPVDTVATPTITAHAIPTLRETLTNVARHAHATAVSIELHARDGSLQLRVTDNGTGLPTTPNPAGRGLTNIHQRATDLGGTCTSTANPTGGTTITWTVPTTPTPAGT